MIILLNLLIIIIIIKLIKFNAIKLLIYNESDKKKLETLNGMDLYEKTYDSLTI